MLSPGPDCQGPSWKVTSLTLPGGGPQAGLASSSVLRSFLVSGVCRGGNGAGGGINGASELFRPGPDSPSLETCVSFPSRPLGVQLSP